MNDVRRVSFPYFPVKPESVYFVSCPKQGPEMEAVVLHRVGFLEYFCPKQVQDFKPSAAPQYPNIVPPLRAVDRGVLVQIAIFSVSSIFLHVSLCPDLIVCYCLLIKSKKLQKW